MAVGREQRQRLDRGGSQPDQDLLKDQQELQRLEEGQEISSEQAAHLQPQLGNAALATLLARSAGSDLGSVGGGPDLDEAEELVEAQDEELLSGELEAPLFGGGGGGGGGGGDPWDMGKLFGGDDDGSGGSGGSANPRLRSSPIRPGDGEPLDEEPPDDDDSAAAHVHAVEGALPRRRPDRASPTRHGDGQLRAVEPGLVDAREVARTGLEPEDLVDLAGPEHPLGRPQALGAFLAQAGSSTLARATGRLLAKGAAGLWSSSGATMAARLATLAVCAEAAEHTLSGQSVATVDRAVALALERGAWPLAMRSARRLARRRRLHAPQIAARALGGLPDAETAPHDLGEQSPDSLAGRAVASLLPPTSRVYIPPLRPPQATPPVVADEALAATDALIAALTGGADPRDLPADPVLDRATLQPVLDAATDLVNALGRCQVEFAAAGIAACRVRPDAPVRQVLVHGDRALRLLAREIVAAGDGLVALEGRPRAGLEPQAAPLLRTLRDGVEAIEALRSWVFASVSAAAVREAA